MQIFQAPKPYEVATREYCKHLPLSVQAHARSAQISGFWVLALLENASPMENRGRAGSGCPGTGCGRGGTGPDRTKSAFSSCNVYVIWKGAVARRRGTECVYLAPLWRTHLSTKLGADSSPKSTHPGYRRHVGHDLLVRSILLGLLLIHQRDFFGKFPGVSHNGCYNVMYTETKLKIFLSICSPADAAKHNIVHYARAICRTFLSPFALKSLPPLHVSVGVSSGCKKTGKHLEEIAKSQQ